METNEGLTDCGAAVRIGNSSTAKLSSQFIDEVMNHLIYERSIIRDSIKRNGSSFPNSLDAA